MSDQNLAGAPGAFDEESGGDRRPLVLLAVAVVAALAVAVYFLFLSGGGTPEDEFIGAPAASQSTSPDSVKATPSASAPAGKPKPTVEPADADDKPGRDPFEPLVVAPDPTPEPVANPTPTPTPTPSGSTGGTGVAPTPAPTPAPVVIARLTMTSANGDKSTASFKVDGTVYKNVAVGETFGTYFQLYGVFSGQCAGVLYGDSSINLCVGGTVPVYA